MPMVRFAAMNSSAEEINGPDVAEEWNVKHIPRGQQNDRRLNEPDDDVGNDLAGHHFDRRGRHGQQVLHRAAFALARDREPRHHHHGHGQDHAHQARHDVVLRDVVRDCKADAPAHRRRPVPPSAPRAGRSAPSP